MSLDIVSRTIGGELDKKFVLRNHQCARLMSIQDDWTRLRIGARLAFEDTGASISGTPRFYLGLLAAPSSGLQNGPLSIATSHFVGIRQSGATLARNAGPPASYTTALSALTKVGSTVNQLGSTSAVITADPANRRIPIIVEFLKGSPNWTVTVLVSTSTLGANQGDIDYDTMVQAMEAETMNDGELILDAVGQYADTVVTSALPVDEATNGLLTAVCFAWDRSTVDLEWSELLFAKFA